MSRRLLVVVALGVVASAIVPTVSQAQFGKLKKAATQTAANAAGVPTSPPRYVKSIDMTSAQIAQVNKGMQTAIQVGPETIKRWEKAQPAYEKAHAEWQKKKEAYDKCFAAENDKWQAKIGAAKKKTDAAGEQVKQGMPSEDAMVEQAKAAQAALERVNNGVATAADQQTLADYQKTMGGVQGNTKVVMAAMQEQSALQTAMPDSLKAKCGTEQPEPNIGAAAGAKPGKNGAMPTSASEEIVQAAADAAGMTTNEYRTATEKAAGYAASHTQVQGGSDTPDAEATAINSALAETSTLVAQANKANVPLM